MSACVCVCVRANGETTSGVTFWSNWQTMYHAVRVELPPLRRYPLDTAETDVMQFPLSGCGSFQST